LTGKHSVVTLPWSLTQVNAETLYCQELSSFTGKQLDEFTLKKPANWVPDTAGRATTAATLVPTHVLSNIEANGFIGQPYSAPLRSISGIDSLRRFCLAESRLPLAPATSVGLNGSLCSADP